MDKLNEITNIDDMVSELSIFIKKYNKALHKLSHSTMPEYNAAVQDVLYMSNHLHSYIKESVITMEPL